MPPGRWIVGCLAAGCAGTAPPRDTQPVLTVSIPAATADAGPAPLVDASFVDAGPSLAALAGAVRPECVGPAFDLTAAQRSCRCPFDLAMPGRLSCPSHPGDVAGYRARARLALVTKVTPPAVVAGGASVSVGITLTNGGSEPLPLWLAADEGPALSLLDAGGQPVRAIMDASCRLAVLGGRELPVAVVVLSPGGVVSTTAVFAAVRMRTVGPSWRRVGRTEVEKALIELDRDGPCRDVVDGPLAAGEYTLQAQVSLWPWDLPAQIGGGAGIRVR